MGRIVVADWHGSLIIVVVVGNVVASGQQWVGLLG